MKAALSSLFVLTFRFLVFNPILEAAAWTSRAMTPATGLVGLSTPDRNCINGRSKNASRLSAHRVEWLAARMADLLGRAERSSLEAAERRAAGAGLAGESAHRAIIDCAAMLAVV